MKNLNDLARKQITKLANARESNRAEAAEHGMQWALDDLDCLRENGFPSASVAHMDNGRGWSKGQRDPGPWQTYRPQGPRA